jgi:hypothetical protein
MPMHAISAEEVDLLAFFEVEPSRVDPDVPWPYNDFAYKVRRGDFDVSFSVMPAYRDAHLLVQRNGCAVYELTALALEDIRYLKDKIGEVLELVVNARDSVQLRLVPEVSVTQTVANELSDGA